MTIVTMKERHMAQRFKSFNAGKKITDYEPVIFELNEEVFQCRPALQGAMLLEFVAKADSEDGASAASALYEFFADVMPEEEYVRFAAYLKNPDIIIDMETIGEIAAWLVEEYTSRPTQPSENSDGGPSNSGHTSTAQLSSVASSSES